MLVVGSVQDELKNAFPELWKEFVSIKPRTYVDTGMAGYAAATALQESHGSGLLFVRDLHRQVHTARDA